MIFVLLSPSKAMNFDPTPVEVTSTPILSEETTALAQVMAGFDADGIADLMGLSDSLAELNHKRFQVFGTQDADRKQAILAFTGDTYKDIPLDAYSEEDFTEAQSRVRILSGLYGVLRPLDLIQPYRLEMGTRLKTDRGTNLYKFWGARVTDALREEVQEYDNAFVLNCASNEYFKVVDKGALGAPVITPVFKDFKNGKYKVISFYAKRARGMLADFVVRNRIDDPEDLRGFDGGDYAYNEDLSSPLEPVFTRESPTNKSTTE